MSGRPPDEIWEDIVEEGHRRLERSPSALAATGLAGGIDILLGIVLMVVVTAGFTPTVGAPGAHVLGSIAFGIAFVHLTVGRTELFTENFLVPVSAVFAGRATKTRLVRMWVITFALNLVGLAIFAGIFSVRGVLDPAMLHSAGTLADTYGDRTWLPALLSGVAAGTVMTLFTWLIAAADSTSARVLLSLLIGFVLGVPSLNHVVVSSGELLFGILAGTAHSGWGDLARNTGLATVGNLIGGVGFVFATRLAQARGEPRSDQTHDPAQRDPGRAGAKRSSRS